MKTRIVIAIALVVSVIGFAFTTPAPKVHSTLDVFYQLKPGVADNDVTNINNWTTISEDSFDDASCPGTQRACVIKASQALTSVPVVVPSGQTYQNPIVSGNVTAVRNRASN